MVEIPYNFPSRYKTEVCNCGEIIDMKHIYNCENNNNNAKQRIPYERIFSNNMNELTEVSKIFENNLENREKQKNDQKSHHVITVSDPLSSIVVENSNG